MKIFKINLNFIYTIEDKESSTNTNGDERTCICNKNIINEIPGTHDLNTRNSK